MQSNQKLQVEDRILQVLKKLGIEKTHVAGRLTMDWRGLATNHPNKVSSLSLICPNAGIEPDILSTLGSRICVLVGDTGPASSSLREVTTKLPEATIDTLENYTGLSWSDVAEERTRETLEFMTEFLGGLDREHRLDPVSLPEGEGEVAGISYHISGTGPPLVLLPLGLAPSQWGPLIPSLSKRYCTITLGGTHLGIVHSLETRGRSGYIRVVQALIDEAAPQSGDTILEVGCGTGVLDRWLARRTGGANKIIGLDINSYTLKEAAALAEKDGLADVIEFRKGSAEALPFEDETFDIAMSSTVMEEVNADLMLKEMIRVTKTGGRIAIGVRATDMDLFVNLDLSPELKVKVQVNTGGSEEHGCSDASLYDRFNQADLTNIKMFPQLGTNSLENLQFFESLVRSSLSSSEIEEWEMAVTQAKTRGTYLVAMPYHCAIGTKT